MRRECNGLARVCVCYEHKVLQKGRNELLLQSVVFFGVVAVAESPFSSLSLSFSFCPPDTALSTAATTDLLFPFFSLSRPFLLLLLRPSFGLQRGDDGALTACAPPPLLDSLRVLPQCFLLLREEEECVHPDDDVASREPLVLRGLTVKGVVDGLKESDLTLCITTSTPHPPFFSLSFPPSALRPSKEREFACCLVWERRRIDFCSGREVSVA